MAETARNAGGAQRLRAEAPPVVKRTPGRRWQVPAGLEERLLDAGGLRLEEWLASGAARIVKQGPHRIVYEVRLPGLSFFVKHNRATDVATWLRQWLRPSKARSE